MGLHNKNLYISFQAKKWVTDCSHYQGRLHKEHRALFKGSIFSYPFKSNFTQGQSINGKLMYMFEPVSHYIINFTQPDFQNAIMWLKDTGILNKLKQDVLNPPIPIPLPMVRDKEPLILKQLGITMIILAVGLFIALMAFLMELGMKRRTSPAQKQNQQFVLAERNIAWL